MNLGQSVPWPQALGELTDGDEEEVSAEPLLEYYAPLQAWLEREVQEKEIPLGWW